MKVKVCGITNVDDAAEAVRLGAWAIGLIHHKASPRSVRFGVASEIGGAFRRDCEIVGVFVNPTLERVASAVENANLSMVQLSGDEGPSFCTEVARRTGTRVIKAIHVSSAADIHQAEAFRTEFHLFDTGSSGEWGGTGRAFDWDLLEDHHSVVPFMIAGGLNPDNVTEAVRITRPDAVDVASGVEKKPGLKDHGLMASFFEAARYTPVVGS
ncbi:MAG: phosphoribosylanthranilate isomerase [Solirubrobacterales bacterium]